MSVKLVVPGSSGMSEAEADEVWRADDAGARYSYEIQQSGVLLIHVMKDGARKIDVAYGNGAWIKVSGEGFSSKT